MFGLEASTLSFPRIQKRMLILGTGKLARELCQSLLEKKGRPYMVVGFLDPDRARIGEPLVNPGIIGTFDQVFELVEKHKIKTIAVCQEDRRRCLPIEALLDCKAMGIEVTEGLHILEEAVGRFSLDSTKPSALIFSAGFRRRNIMLAGKRFMDLILSIFGLCLLSLLFVVVGFLIKWDSPGPVFFCQTRIGRWGKPYKMLKFRSMKLNAESGGSQWAREEDPRITMVGKFLRKWRIDELPQVINVLLGQMSLVGPRPERPIFVHQLRKTIPYYDLRHTVRPGITGWAQIRFRYAASTEDSEMKLQYDLYYLKHLSLLMDFRILVETIRVVLLGEGAR